MDVAGAGVVKPDQLLNKRNVIGHSEERNQVTVYVSRKLKMNTIQRKISDPDSPWSDEDVIPFEVKTGLGKRKPTDVVQIGRIKAHSNRRTYRPLKAGCEISPAGERFVGTAGCIVRYPYLIVRNRVVYLIGRMYSFVPILERYGVKVLYAHAILTNCHVTQKNVLKPVLDLDIHQPMIGKYVGSVSHAVALKDKGYNDVDVSLVDLDDHDVGFTHDIIRIGKVRKPRDPWMNEFVHKYGRTTEYTEGQLVRRNLTVKVDYKGTICTFKGVDMYSRMSAPGDSGSLILSKGNQALGLLFAGSSSVTLGIPISTVLKRFKGIEVVLGE